jgi:hypothetical protein
MLLNFAIEKCFQLFTSKGEKFSRISFPVAGFCDDNRIRISIEFKFVIEGGYHELYSKTPFLILRGGVLFFGDTIYISVVRGNL